MLVLVILVSRDEAFHDKNIREFTVTTVLYTTVILNNFPTLPVAILGRTYVRDNCETLRENRLCIFRVIVSLVILKTRLFDHPQGKDIRARSIKFS